MTKRLADIAAESILIAGGGRAILLQVAHPAVGRGVARHSDFAADPIRRLRATLTYVYLLANGDHDEIRRMATRVNAAHARVRGDDYAATDPELQLWVAATLYDTAITVYERMFGALGAADAEAIYQDYAILGTALQMPAELWPADRDAFRAYWDRTVPLLRVDDDTRRICRDLLYPARVPLWLRLSMPLARLVTAGLLSEDQRVMYGLEWNGRRQRRFDRALRLIATTYPRLPARVRRWPRDHYVRRFRATAHYVR